MQGFRPCQLSLKKYICFFKKKRTKRKEFQAPPRDRVTPQRRPIRPRTPEILLFRIREKEGQEKEKQTKNTCAMLKKKVGVFSCMQHDNCCLNRFVATAFEKKKKKKTIASCEAATRCAWETARRRYIKNGTADGSFFFFFHGR